MRFVFGLLAIFFSQLVSANSAIDSVCEHPDLNIDRGDCRALVDFYYSFNVSSTDLKDSWGNTDVSRWKGIKVEANRVHAINLPTSESESLSGEFLESFKNLSELRELNIRGAIYRAALPDFWSSFPNLEVLVLTAKESNYINVFPSSILGLKRLVKLELGWLKIRGKLPDFSNLSRSLEVLKLHGNLFYGEVNNSISELKNTRRINLSGNRFLWGTFPFQMVENGVLTDLILESSHFWGELPDYILGDAQLRDRHIYFILGNNHFTNVPGRYKQASYENGSYQAHFGRQTLSVNQEEHSVDISVESGSFGSVVLSPKEAGQDSKIFLVPDDGYKVKAVSGCKGTLSDNVFYISPNQASCDAKISFTKCINNSCSNSVGSTSSIANAKIESPSNGKLLSGVVQLRGWIFPSQWDDLFDYREENGGKYFSLEIDGGERQRYYTTSHRDDVLNAMSVQLDEEDAFIGWGVQIYTGELANGEHNIKLFNSAGLMLESVDFRVFNPLSNGQVKYISGVERTETISDFPVKGHTTEIAFNVAEQNFTVVNQFNANGESVRSLERHTVSIEQRLYRDTYLRQSPLLNDYSASKIENPQNNKVFSGVQSLRGWLIADSETEEDGSNVNLYSGFFNIPSINQGAVMQKPLSFHRRQDVNNAFDVGGDVGWSFLFYSGLLENGWYDAEIVAYRGNYGELQYKSLLNRVEFLSFTPVNESGEQFYVRSYDQDILVEDFPYQGSDVTLRFDPAGQNFVIVDQVIH